MNKAVEMMTESRFYMWRAVFALAHADHIVTDEEQRIMQKALETENFTEMQKDILTQDMTKPQDIMAMFMQIKEQEDRSRFFYFARMMCWSDGDFAEQEQKILLSLKKVHIRNIDFDRLMKNLDMELDETEKKMMVEDMTEHKNPMRSFFHRFCSKNE